MENYYFDFFEKEEERIKGSIEKYIHNKLNCSAHSLLENEIYCNYKVIFIEQLKSLINSEELNQYIFNIINREMENLEKNQVTFKEVLPKGFENNLKVIVYNSSPGIILELKKSLKIKSTENKIKAEINKFISTLNPMIAKFLNSDNIYTKMMQGVDNYFSNPDSSIEVVGIISKFIDGGMDKEINRVTMYLPFEGRKALIDKLQQGLIKIILSDEVINKIFYQGESYIKSYTSIYELLSSLNQDVDSIIKTQAENMFNFIKLN